MSSYPFSRLVLACTYIAIISGCSVQSGKIPVGTAEISPALAAQGRAEIKERLSSVYQTTAAITRIHNVVKRGLADRDQNQGSQNAAVDSLMFEPSAADTLIFDENHPEAFQYRLNNTTTMNLKTKAGGKITFVLSGSLEEINGKVKIKNAKLDVQHESRGASQTFHLLVETHTNNTNETTTVWSLDFSELSSLYREMGGDDTALAKLSGNIQITMSNERTDISGKNFSTRQNDVAVTFDILEIHAINNPFKLEAINVSGSITRDNSDVGQFSVERNSLNGSTELSLNLGRM